jgi:hypothetical protein
MRLACAARPLEWKIVHRILSLQLLMRAHAQELCATFQSGELLYHLRQGIRIFLNLFAGVSDLLSQLPAAIS